MSFTNRIQSYTNSTTGLDVTGALDKGIDYTIGVTANLSPDMLRLFAYKVNLGTHIGLELDFMETYNLSHLIDVQRGLQFCRPITDRQLNDIIDPSSIYYALPSDPVYFLDGAGKLTIKPATANATETRGYLFAVPHSGGRSIDDTNELIRINGWSHNDVTVVTSASDDSGFPDVLYELVVMHASECLLMERLIDFRTKLPTDLDADTTLFDAIADLDVSLGSMTATLPSAFTIATSLPSFTAPSFPSTEAQDALTKAQNLIDGTSMGGDTEPESAQYWLADEDEDMVASTLSVASTELNRAGTILSDYQAELSGNVQNFNSEVTKFQQEIAKESQRTGITIQAFQAELSHKVADKQQELAEFQAMLAKKLQLYNTIIQKTTVDYQWTSTQIQMLAQKKQEFIQTHLKLGPQGSPGDEIKV